ncbi:hypothetical protein PQQ72_15740 [Paraburkholderia strydomiana]|uniref:hypothetical protein n=1 Tax=Paraburkholderia strydomiana TaxID=1245417 RepID=UPI0038BD40C0
MRQLNGAKVYSASDVMSFLECEHSTTLALIDLVSPLPCNPEDEQLALVQERGLVHERAYLATLTEQGRRVIDIHQHAGKDVQSRVEATLQAMRDGYDVIYQAAFLDGNLLGYADFLVKVPLPSVLGDYGYELIDTKLAHSSRSKFLVQLCFYAHLLAKAQARYPEHMRVLWGSNREAVYRCADYRYYFDTALARFVARVELQPTEAGT